MLGETPSFSKESSFNHEDELFTDIDLIITDVDATLVYPTHPGFLNHYSDALNEAIARYYGISTERGREIADYFRREFGAAEVSIFQGLTHDHFPDIPVLPPDYAMVHMEMSKIDPSSYFQHNEAIKQAVADVRGTGIKVAALTDSPDILSRNILSASGIVPEDTFDAFYAFTPQLGPHKKVRPDRIFTEIAEAFGIDHHRVLAIGDSMKADINPAREVHMRTCLISPDPLLDYTGTQRTSALEVFNTVRDKKLGL